MAFVHPAGLRGFVGIAIFLSLVVVGPSRAQTDPLSSGENRMRELVDDLKDLIQKADRDESSDPRLIRQLRDLVGRYDWPWKIALLHDDFRDGDYTYDPPWIVSHGKFRVVNGSGLSTVFDAARPDHQLADRKGSHPGDVLEEIFADAIQREAADELTTTPPSAAEIYTQLDISASFAVKVHLKSRGYFNGNNRLEFGPYLTDERDSGYRLAYEAGNTPSISLLRVASGRSTVIGKYDRDIEMADGNPHMIEWRRRADGEMFVFLDEKEIIRTVHRAQLDWFDGFSVVNKGGDYELKEISILGAYR